MLCALAAAAAVVVVASFLQHSLSRMARTAAAVAAYLSTYSLLPTYHHL
jgi:hypothetical protein